MARKIFTLIELSDRDCNYCNFIGDPASRSEFGSGKGAFGFLHFESETDGFACRMYADQNNDILAVQFVTDDKADNYYWGVEVFGSRKAIPKSAYCPSFSDHVPGIEFLCADLRDEDLRPAGRYGGPGARESGDLGRSGSQQSPVD